MAAVTDPDGPDFIPVSERVAVFDNDGTSWCERPDYAPTSFQVSLARSMAAQVKADPDTMPFKAWFANVRDALRSYGYGQAYIDMNATFAGMPVEAYRDSARAWLENTRHSRSGVRHSDLYYPPMMELKDLLLEIGFQVCIVTAQRRGMALWIHHDDSEREYDYDRGARKIAELCERNPRAFEVSIQRDWTRVFREVSLE